MKKIWEKNYTYHKKKFKLKFFETENSTKLGLYNLDDSELLIKTFANGKENYITYTSIITNSDKFQIENDREDIEKIIFRYNFFTFIIGKISN